MMTVRIAAFYKFFRFPDYSERRQALAQCFCALGIKGTLLLAEEGVNAEVIDPVSIRPLDFATIKASALRTGKVIIVDNAWVDFGTSAEIAARIAEDDDLSGIKVRRMGYAPTTCPTTPWLEEHFYPNPATIATLAHGLARPGAATWTPDPARAKLAYQTQFRGPF